MRLPHPFRVAILLATGTAMTLAGCATPAGDAGPAATPLPPWAWELSRCVAYQPEAYAAAAHRVSATVDDAGGGHTVTEVYEPGWGPLAVEEIRAVLRACGSFEAGQVREQHLLVPATATPSSPADESLLVETVWLAPPTPMRTGYAAVVRTGDVVVTVRTNGSEPDDVLRLAAALAAAGQ